MDRSDLQALARIRLEEASGLLKNGYDSGSYYLCGYAVECALKACVAKRIRRHEFPDRKLANDSHTHDLENLIRVAGLEVELQSRSAEDEEFAVKWGVVKDWSGESRYAIISPRRHKSFSPRSPTDGMECFNGFAGIGRS